MSGARIEAKLCQNHRTIHELDLVRYRVRRHAFSTARVRADQFAKDSERLRVRLGRSTQGVWLRWPGLLRELKLPNPGQLALAGVRQSENESLALYGGREFDVFGELELETGLGCHGYVLLRAGIALRRSFGGTSDGIGDQLIGLAVEVDRGEGHGQFRGAF